LLLHGCASASLSTGNLNSWTFVKCIFAAILELLLGNKAWWVVAYILAGGLDIPRYTGIKGSSFRLSIVGNLFERHSSRGLTEEVVGVIKITNPRAASIKLFPVQSWRNASSCVLCDEE